MFISREQRKVSGVCTHGTMGIGPGDDGVDTSEAIILPTTVTSADVCISLLSCWETLLLPLVFPT